MMAEQSLKNCMTSAQEGEDLSKQSPILLYKITA